MRGFSSLLLLLLLLLLLRPRIHSLSVKERLFPRLSHTQWVIVWFADEEANCPALGLSSEEIAAAFAPRAKEDERREKRGRQNGESKIGQNTGHKHYTLAVGERGCTSSRGVGVVISYISV